MASGDAVGPPVSWLPLKGDEIDEGLAAEFDGSLSGLGVDLGGNNAYNMSEALMALPVFKQEAAESEDQTKEAITQLAEILPCPDFQYYLHAVTSPASKIEEDTLTYLNQGQPYQLSFTVLNGEFPTGPVLKSVVKVLFHERRLQYVEKQQLETWKKQRPGERLIDIDKPLSYGVTDVRLDATNLNEMEFKWDPARKTGIFIKVHAISTEFTPKKHGGEKGVSFKIQVETYWDQIDKQNLLHCSACQVKVFKPKGADRKNKTDRDKMARLNEAEKHKYQPSYNCTLLASVALESVASKEDLVSSKALPVEALQKEAKTGEATPSAVSNSNTDTSQRESSAPKALESPVAKAATQDALSTCATAQQVSQWLHSTRFSQYVRTFQNFAGADLLRLSRDDLIQICGLADGIRLNNALQYRKVRPRLTIYVCQDSSPEPEVPGAIQNGDTLLQESADQAVRVERTGSSTSQNLDAVLESLSLGVQPTQQDTSLAAALQDILSDDTTQRSTSPAPPPARENSPEVVGGSPTLSVATLSLQTIELPPVPASAVDPKLPAESKMAANEGLTTPEVKLQGATSTGRTIASASRRRRDHAPPPATPTQTIDLSALGLSLTSVCEQKQSGGHSTRPQAKRQYNTTVDPDEEQGASSNKKLRRRVLEMHRKEVYHALYLDDLTVETLSARIADLYSVSSDMFLEMYIVGPSGILILCTNKVIENLCEETRYSVQALQDDILYNKYRLILRPQS